MKNVSDVATLYICCQRQTRSCLLSGIRKELPNFKSEILPENYSVNVETLNEKPGIWLWLWNKRFIVCKAFLCGF
jgi:alpha,alpha-trehalase